MVLFVLALTFLILAFSTAPCLHRKTGGSRQPFLLLAVEAISALNHHIEDFETVAPAAKHIYGRCMVQECLGSKCTASST